MEGGEMGGWEDEEKRDGRMRNYNNINLILIIPEQLFQYTPSVLPKERVDGVCDGWTFVVNGAPSILTSPFV